MQQNRLLGENTMVAAQHSCQWKKCHFWCHRHRKSTYGNTLVMLPGLMTCLAGMLLCSCALLLWQAHKLLFAACQATVYVQPLKHPPHVAENLLSCY